MKFIDFFAGIGGFHSGLKKAGHEMVGWVEWDKFARQSYKAIYDTEGKYTANDIKSIKNGRELPSAGIWAFGSPCTNISLAGNRKGLQGEQSSMFFEVIRLLNDRDWEEKPTYLLMENVKNLLGSNKGFDFFRVLYEMDKAGYDVEWEVFNSSWVIPQNRERVYLIGHKRGVSYSNVFPINRTELEKSRQYSVLRDVFESTVDKKYFLSEAKIQQLLTNRNKLSQHHNGKIKVVGNTSNTGPHSEDVLDASGISQTITTVSYKHPIQVATKIQQIGNIVRTMSFGGNPQRGRVYSANGLSPTLNTMQGGGLIPKVLANIDSNTKQDQYTIRKLTPLECWRLQGFADEQFYKAKRTGISNSQLYKQAGNAVTVPIVEAIARKMK